MKIYLITEGSKEFGFGHIVRNLSLYYAFLEKNETPQLVLYGDESVLDLLKGISVIFLEWYGKDQSTLISTIKACDLAIVDSYHAPISIYKEISSNTKIPVFIDDYQRLAYPKGIVLNSGLNAEKLVYNNYPNLSHFLGSKYTMLRPEFWQKNQKTQNPELKSLFITLGGTDIRNLTYPIIKHILKKFQNIIITTVISPKAQDFTRITSIKNPNLQVRTNCNALEMKKIMMNTDLAICAGGQTLYELTVMEVPTILICLAENQRNNCINFQELNISDYVGFWDTPNLVEKIELQINKLSNLNLRLFMTKNGLIHINPQGSRVLVQELRQKHKEFN